MPVTDRADSRCQALRRMFSISPTGTPYTSATCASVIPYFTQVRIRANCDRGISDIIRCLGPIGEAAASRPTKAGGEIICSTRGLRAAGSAGASAGTVGVLIGGFEVNNASAA